MVMKRKKKEDDELRTKSVCKLFYVNVITPGVLRLAKSRQKMAL